MNRLTRPAMAGLLSLAAILTLQAPALAKHKGHPPLGGAVAPSLPANFGSRSPAQVPFGSYCFTPLGRVGPIPVGPVGSPCMGPSGQGPIAGQIVH